MPSFRRWNPMYAVALVAALAPLAGCASDDPSSKSADSPESTAQALAQQSPAARAAHGRRPPPGGPDFLLVAALHELDDLSAAQRAKIQGALDGLEADRKAHGPKDQAAFAALATGVRAGAIDEAAVLAKVEAAPAGVDAHRAALATALQTLHDTLSVDQRRALVTSLAAHMNERGKDGERHRPPPGAEGDAPPPPDADGERGHRGPPMGPGGMGPGPLGFLLHGLDLTDAQKESIHKAMEANKPSEAERDAMKQRFEAMHATLQKRLATFAEDRFDANAFVTPPDGAMPGPREHFQRVVKEMKLVVPILEPAQRETLAALLEKGPPMGPPPGGKRGAKGR